VESCWLFIDVHKKAWTHANSAPLEAGIHNSNGLNWILYVDSSSGHPVDIAMADSGNFSLIIMMFSHTDEHDALYQTVFLPMIDSAK
jgi:hypothetical protein